MTKSFDDLLREARQGGPGGQPPAACRDPATAAAWIDGELSAEDRALAETHVADCPRCQRLLAAMVATSPAVSVRAGWLAPAARWLVPLTAAAASLLVWVTLADRPTDTPAVPELRSEGREGSVSPREEGKREKGEGRRGEAPEMERGKGTREKEEDRRDQAQVKRDKDEGRRERVTVSAEAPAADTRHTAA